MKCCFGRRAIARNEPAPAAPRQEAPAGSRGSNGGAPGSEEAAAEHHHVASERKEEAAPEREAAAAPEGPKAATSEDPDIAAAEAAVAALEQRKAGSAMPSLPARPSLPVWPAPRAAVSAGANPCSLVCSLVPIVHTYVLPVCRKVSRHHAALLKRLAANVRVAELMSPSTTAVANACEHLLLGGGTC